MKRKLVIVAAVLWFVCVAGGAFWGRAEQYLKGRSITPGQREVQDLKDLYEAKLYDEVLSECDRADRDPRYSGYEPQILYIRWATDRRTERSDQAEFAQRTFLQRFPDHILAADMHFARAMDLLASADYLKASSELTLIQDRYPTAAVAAKSSDMLSRLRAATLSTRATIQNDTP